MGHGHMPYKIPSYHTYDNYRELAPELVKHEERLARAGLKDPWIRNCAFMFMGTYRRGKYDSLKYIFKCGWKLGVGVAAAVIALEESYMYYTRGHTSWGAHH